MAKKIRFGKTLFKDLHLIFNFDTEEEFNKKKSRLFPSGNPDKELAVTSIFLASLSAVKEYREDLFLTIGVKKIKTKNVNVHTYTELIHSESKDRPDGLIVITSGKLNPIVEWAGFVEAKIGNNKIYEEQIEKYSSFSREIGINEMITISNDLVTNPFQSPIKITKRSFKIYHWSWNYLKVTASRLIRTDMIEDLDHIYILSELRRFFDSHKNLCDSNNMSSEWKDSINKIHSINDKKIDKITLSNVSKSYSQSEKNVSLNLTDSSNFLVELIAKENRIIKLEEMLQVKKRIISSYKLNSDKNFTFDVEIDFIKREITCKTKKVIDSGKAKAQTSKLISYLENEAGTTEKILINAFYIRNKTNNSNSSLFDLINQKSKSEYYSILDKKYGDTVKYFEIKTKDYLGKDFQGVRVFPEQLNDITKRFLNQVMINLN